MDFDSTPSTLYVTEVKPLVGRKAHMLAYDDLGAEFIISLDIGVISGPKRWFAETIQDMLNVSGKHYPLISRYDERADEWFCLAGNYGIRTSDLQFTEID